MSITDPRGSGRLAGRLVAIDIDGTLIDSSGVLRERTATAIAATAEAGAAIVLATGRDWYAVEPLLAMLPAVSHAVCTNGIEILRADGTELRSAELDPGVARDAVEAIRRRVPGATFGVGIGGQLIGEIALAAVWPPSLGAVPTVDDIVEALGPGLRDIVVFHPDHAVDRAPLFAMVGEVLPPRGIEVAYTGLPMVELVPPGSGKDAGLAWLCEHLRIAQADVVAFGDGMNDISMLRWAGLGVAMGHATDLVLAAADEATASNDEDGVARWLEAWSTATR